MPDQPFWKSLDFTFQKFGGRIRPSVQPVPATQFHLTQLRMVELVPIHIALAFEFCVAPFKDLPVISDRMLAEPIKIFIVLDSGLPDWTPDLHRPGEDAEMIVHPGIERAGSERLGMIFKIMKDRDVRITRQP